jgi:hypothetical protein
MGWVGNGYVSIPGSGIDNYSYGIANGKTSSYYYYLYSASQVRNTMRTPDYALFNRRQALL